MTARTVSGRRYGGEQQKPLVMRSLGNFDRRAYDRAYYHLKRKPRRQVYNEAQRSRRRELRRIAYRINVDEERAKARERMRKVYARKARRTA